MHTNSERVNLALEKLREVKKEVKCSEDFVESHNYPTFNLENIKEFSKKSDFFKILQILMLNKTSRECLAWFEEKSLNLFDQPQLLSLQVASLLINGYGECGETSYYLMLKLMETTKFSMISRYEIQTNNIHVTHQFITIEDESGIEWVLDPLFNICCPLKDYWENEKLIGYFNKHLRISDWNINHSKLEVKEYSIRIQQMALPIYKEQIKTLCSVARTTGHPSIEANQKAQKITSNNYEEGLIYMKEFFVKDVMELNNANKERATSFVNRYFEGIPLNESSNNNSQEIPSNNSNSNTDFFKDPNELIATKLEKVFPRNGESKSFWTAIDSKEYSKALRMVCTMPSKEVSLQLAKVICQFKNELSIDITQKNSAGFSAIDYARQKNNEPLLKFLESQIEKEPTLSTTNSNN